MFIDTPWQSAGGVSSCSEAGIALHAIPGLHVQVLEQSKRPSVRERLLQQLMLRCHAADKLQSKFFYGQKGLFFPGQRSSRI